MGNIILTPQDIIRTYDKRQQEQCGLYYKYKQIKQRNPTFGYKRIAKILGHTYGKTRWWHAAKHTPVPTQTVSWLEKKQLIPLILEDPRLPSIAKVLGATFGDGGIFGNLNGIFLSSSELEAVKEFGDDLKLIFGEEIEKNSRIIEGGIYGHSWCYQNTNRNIIRFFQALGAPIGRKSKIDLEVPNWIFLKNNLSDEFFGSFFGSEINIPKVHINKTHLDTFSIGIVSNKGSEENRLSFLFEIKRYLENKGVQVGSISRTRNKKSETDYIYRLLISTKINNVINFKKNVKIHYCKYKSEKLEKTLDKFIELKRERYKDLLAAGYSKEATMKLLKINENPIKNIFTT